MANTWTTLLDAVYPVGAVYISWSTTSPATLFGGTWTNINGGRYLSLVGTSNTAGTSQGANTRSLTIANMPKHDHNSAEASVLYDKGWSVAGGDRALPAFGGSSSSLNSPWYYQDLISQGSGTAFNNQPLTYICFGWRRTA